MSRWRWIRERDQRLKSGTLEVLGDDIAYCRQRLALAKLKSHVQAWQQRRAEAEQAVIQRFGEEALESLVGNSRAWGKK